MKEAEAHVDAQDAREKLMALLERMHEDKAEAERLWKEWDDLLQTIEGFHTELDLAHQECANT